MGPMLETAYQNQSSKLGYGVSLAYQRRHHMLSGRSVPSRAEAAVKESVLWGDLEWVEFSVKENHRDGTSSCLVSS